MTIVEDYRAATAGSLERWLELRKVMPNGNTRNVAVYPPYPVVIISGYGCRVQDVDGNEYLDLLNNYTSLVHGHSHPKLVEAADKAVRGGTVFPSPHPVQGGHARALIDRIPSAQLVRYTNSGTEAAMLATRVARAFTSRDTVAKARWGYHGSCDSLWPYSVLVQRDNESRSTRIRSGVPDAVQGLTKVFEFNDIGALRSVCRDSRDRLAAVIVEPMLGSGGGILATEDFLHACRDTCDETGALLIFDEVQTFRLHEGGMQSFFGILPDLTILGKFIGGGFPIGAIAGQERVLALFGDDETSHVSHSGTFNGNMCSMNCGLIALQLLDRHAIDQINGFGRRMAEEVRTMMSAIGLLGCVTGEGSILNIHLGIAEAHSGSDVLKEDKRSMEMLHLALLNERVLAASRGMMNLSTVMSDREIDDALVRIERALLRVREEV